MFKPIRVLLLLMASLVVTAALYWLDSDPPTDSISQTALNTAIVFIVVTLIYSGAYWLKRQNKKATRRRGQKVSA